MSPDGPRLCLNDGRGGRPLRSLACPSASCTWPNIECSRCVCNRVSAASWCTGVRRLSQTLEISLARGRNCHPSTVFHKKMYQSNRSNTLPLHHDAARNMHLEISSYTQVKNGVCARCMAEQTGVHGVICHAEARKYVPDHALELILPVLMPPRACAVHARHIHARRWHRMVDKCTPAAPNQLLTGIQALLMQSSCLFRLNPADNAACAPRYTAAQPCRPAPRMPAHSQNLAWTQNFSKSKMLRSERSRVL